MNSYSDRPYPLFRRNLKLEEFYKKVSERNSRASLKKRFSKKELVLLFAVFVFFVSSPFVIQRLQYQQKLQSLADQNATFVAQEAEAGEISPQGFKVSDYVASNSTYVDFGSQAGLIDIASCPTPDESLKRLRLTVNIPSSGTYYLWSRVSSSQDGSSSYYLQVDGQCTLVVGESPIPSDKWIWINARHSGSNRIFFNLSANPHTFTLYAKDPFLKIDRILLTTDQKCIPLLTGNNCLENKIR